MIAGQLLVVLGVRMVLHLTLPLAALLAIVGLEAALNLVGMVCRRRGEPREWWLVAIMAADIVLFTGLLYFTGGPSNPFSFLYLVQIALAAITVRAAWSWALTGLALLGSAVLFLVHSPLSTGISHASYMELHLRGMWVAFGVAAGFIAYFLFRVRRALEQREAELNESRRAAARQDRLASLATLAAGAAHELSTPLATIAVAVKELEREQSHGLGDAETLSDIRLIREQVDRCRAILERMSSDAGESIAESLAPVTVGELMRNAVAGLASRIPVRCQIPAGATSLRMWLPHRAMAQALRGLMKNAQEASFPDGDVRVDVVARPESIVIAIEDHGPGIPRPLIDRIGEPFFTTKPPGTGMGLGVFLARAVVERLGGQVRFQSQPGRGTIAILQLPFPGPVPEGPLP
jgi:two-component system, sensor histidine kinase RegB